MREFEGRVCWSVDSQSSRRSSPRSRGGADNPFPAARTPTDRCGRRRRVTRLFTQDAYTEYAILEPGSEEFRIRFLPEETRVGATELVNATRGGSEGSGVEVYDPRTGKPLKFTYQQEGNDPENHAIHAKLPIPVPQGGVGRVLIYKTYKDPRTYMMHGDDIVWVRSLSGYRLGVLLPKGFAFISSNVAAQLTTTADGRLKLAFANPSGQSNPVTIHARKTTATFPPRSRHRHVLRRREDALRPRRAGDADASRSSRPTATIARATRAQLDTLGVPAAAGSEGGRSRHRRSRSRRRRKATATFVKLDVPIVDDKQSAHLKITGTLEDAGYNVGNGELVFDRTLHGLRNTVLLPAGMGSVGRLAVGHDRHLRRAARSSR